MRTVATVAPPLAKPDWFASWFDSAHYHRLYSHRDQAEARAFVDRLIDPLEPARGASMLDLGCGSGRHARSLAARGFRVTGMISRPAAWRARDRSRPGCALRRTGHAPAVRRQRIRLVFSLFTSFGLRRRSRSLERRWQHRRGADRRRHAGARLSERASRRAAPGRERRGLSRRVLYRLTRWSTAQAFFKRIEIHDPTLPAPLEYVERVAKLTLGDFQRLFDDRGLAIEQVYGDYQLAPFDAIESPRLILVAARRSTRARSAPRQALPDTTERLGSDAEIRGQHGLRNAPHDRGVGREESRYRSSAVALSALTIR